MAFISSYTPSLTSQLESFIKSYNMEVERAAAEFDVTTFERLFCPKCGEGYRLSADKDPTLNAILLILRCHCAYTAYAITSLTLSMSKIPLLSTLIDILKNLTLDHIKNVENNLSSK